MFRFCSDMSNAKFIHPDSYDVPCLWQMPPNYAAKAAASSDKRRAEAAVRHRRWIASISGRDWARLAKRADLVLAGSRFARIDDLDAEISIYVASPAETHPPNGERFGVLKTCPLLAWPKGRG